MSIVRLFGGLLLAAIAMPAIAQTPLLNPVFQDHAVLQRDRAIALWGHVDPNADVTVSLAGNSATAHADAAGNWTANLPAMPAGGPYALEAKSGGDTQRIDDVLVGDVWLCSGQSNMQLQVKHTLDADGEIAGVDSNTIRMLTIPDVASPSPLTVIGQGVSWQVTSPATAGDFSAACYYFARELQKTVHVPMGLVNASWGGSKIRTWMSEQALRASGLFDPSLDVLDFYAKDPQSAQAPFGTMWEAWWKRSAPSAPGQEPWSPSLDDSAWPQAPALGFWDDWGVPALVNRTGLVWYRTSVDLSAEQAAHPASLAIGQVDEIGAAWINGVFAGDGSAGNQTYKLPPGTLHAGRNVIAVNILNTYKKGGLIGPSSGQGLLLDDGSTVPLTGPWRYSLVPQNIAEPPRAPWEPLGGMGMAYNGMIAPLGSYGFRGALWYQGESDTGETENYRKLLPGLMGDWRNRFGSELPFLIVQLPNFGMAPVKPADSGWARLRDVQRAVVAADKHAALTVTIDLGEAYDIHPPNKQEVGRRLALAARRLVYGENVAANGPVAQSAVKQGNRVIIGFTDVQQNLVAHGWDAPIGFELCGAVQTTCRYAAAMISGNHVYLSIPAKFVPMHVRYCWADGPVCTLFDNAGFPAAPFDLTIKPTFVAKKATKAVPHKRTTH